MASDSRFTFTLSAAEKADLAYLADYWGCSRGQALRRLIMIGRAAAHPNLQIGVQLKGTEVKLPEHSE